MDNLQPTKIPEEPKNKTLAKVTKGIIGNTANALNSLRRQPKGEQPFWIDDDAWPANEILACSNGLIHLPSYVAGEPDYMRPLTPRFFSTLNLGYPFEANGPEPRRWLDFLNQLWPDDPDSIALLQEYGGYLITLDNQYQSALMMRGPKRAGKGTICRIWEAMLGRDNVTATSLSALGEPHGLQNLIGKSFAVMGDERIGRRTDRTASVRNLLGIIGNDLVYVNPKYGAPFDCRLNVRFAIVTNELLDLPDTAGALAARLLVLRLSQSFAGREDRNLEPELLKELPGILRWHIAGWARLRKQGKFTQPASGAELLDEFADANNPIGAFIKACCVLGPDNWTESQDLYAAYRQWCESTGRTPLAESHFFRELSTAAPEVRQRRSRRGEIRQSGYAGIGLTSPEPCRLILPMGTPATWVEELFAEYIANPPPFPQDLLAYAKGA